MRVITYLPLFASLVAGSTIAACSSDAETSSATSTTATSGPGGSGGAGGGAALTPTTFCEAYAKASCAATEACNCPTVAGAKDCVESNVDKCEGSLAGLIAAVSLGDVAFVAEAASACVEDASKTLGTCAAPTSRNRPKTCGLFFRDGAKLNEDCSKFGAGLRCADGAGACDGMTGKCVVLGGKDEPCAGTACIDGLVCDGGVCVALKTKGGVCGVDDVCESGLVCVDGACDTPRAKGETCSDSTRCAAGLGCIAGKCDAALAEGEGCEFDGCSAESTCLAMPGLKSCMARAKAGEPCMMFNDCEQGTECDYSKPKPVCVALPKLGESCPLGQCLEGASCSDGTCVTTPKLGEACAVNSGVACAAGLGCLSGTCTAGAPAGQPCVGDQAACAAGAACDFAANPIVCRAQGDEGAACDSNDAFCKTGLHCDTATNKCAKPVALGKPCTSLLGCEPGAYCEYGEKGGVCATLPSKTGDKCLFECGAGLRCGGPNGKCAKGACTIR